MPLHNRVRDFDDATTLWVRKVFKLPPVVNEELNKLLIDQWGARQRIYLLLTESVIAHLKLHKADFIEAVAGSRIEVRIVPHGESKLA